MELCRIPVCYLRSKTLFVDDSQDFLMNFSLQLPDDFNYQLHTSPNSAQHVLQHIENTQALYHACLGKQIQTQGSPLTTQGLQIDISEIYKILYNPDRFAEIGVVVVDYAMPGMDGITFCEHIKHLPFGRILLTGKADERIAIKAFNDGLIDCYAQKHDPMLAATIKHNIQTLQKRYFQRLSNSLNHILSINGLNCLNDPEFFDLFEQIIANHHIVEYYLVDTGGSFLMLDNQANCHFLLVKTDEDLRYYQEMACDTQAPQTVLDKLATGNFLPSCLLYDNTHATSPDWSQPLIPLKQLQGRQHYHYALTNELHGFDLKLEQISPFEVYLHKHLVHNTD